jgi:hypothetical protein
MRQDGGRDDAQRPMIGLAAAHPQDGVTLVSAQNVEPADRTLVLTSRLDARTNGPDSDLIHGRRI